MATTFVFPTPAADGSLASTRLPLPVADGSLIEGDSRISTPTFGSSSNGFLPAPLLSPLYYVHVPSGGYVWGGRAAIVGDPFVPTGGYVWGGSAPVTAWFAYVPTGGINWGGAAQVSAVIVNIYDIANDGQPSGGIRWGGAATVADLITFVPKGGLQWGGSAPVLEHIPYLPSGGVQWSGSARNSSVVNVQPSGGLQWGGSAPNAHVTIVTPSGGLQWGGAATIRDYQAWFTPSGGFQWGGAAVAYVLHAGEALSTANPYNDDFAGWAVNLETGAPSRYLRLAANSFCRFQGKTFVANAGGIYSLDADTDAGQPIAAGITIPKTDYGTDMDKRFSDVTLAARSSGDLRLTVDTHSGVRNYYAIQRTTDLVAQQVDVGRGLRGRWWTLRIDNVAGGDFELESLSFTPDISKLRHGR